MLNVGEYFIYMEHLGSRECLEIPEFPGNLETFKRLKFTESTGPTLLLPKSVHQAEEMIKWDLSAMSLGRGPP